LKQIFIALSFMAGLSARSSPAEEAPASTENELELAVEGMSFVGPDAIKSGWTTIRVVNGRDDAPRACLSPT